MCQYVHMPFSLFGICKKECLKEAICQVLCRNVSVHQKHNKTICFIMRIAFPEGRMALPGPSHHSHTATQCVPTKPNGFCCCSLCMCQWLFNKQWKPGVILMFLADRAWAWLRACSYPTPEMWLSPRETHNFLGLRVSGFASDSSAIRFLDSTTPSKTLIKLMVFRTFHKRSVSTPSEVFTCLPWRP